MFHNDRDPLIAKFASSAAHVMDKSLVSAETGTWLNEHFTSTLADIKILGRRYVYRWSQPCRLPRLGLFAGRGRFAWLGVLRLDRDELSKRYLA